MSWLSVCAIVAIPIVIALVFSRDYSEHERLVVQNRIVRNPHYAAWVGCVGTIIFLGLTVYAFVDGGALWVVAEFILFDIMGLYITAAGVFWKIEYDEEGFYYTNIYRWRTRHSYKDITRINRRRHCIYIHLKGRVLFIDPFALGIDGFISTYDIAHIREKREVIKVKKKNHANRPQKH